MKLNSYEKWKNSAASVCDDLIQEGKPEEAYRLAGKVLLINPSEADVRGRYIKSLQALKKPASFRAEALLLSFLALREQKPTQAAELLESLAVSFPDDVNLKWKLAELARSSNQPDKAELLYLWLAGYYLNKNLPERAVRAYREAAGLNPDKLEHREKIAEIYVKQGMANEAIAEYFELANHYLEKKMADKSVPLLEKVLALDPVQAHGAMLLARIYLDQNQTAQASKIARQQVDQRINKGLSDEAVQFNRKWLDLLVSRNLQAQALQDQEHLARALFNHGRKEQAISLFEEAATQALAAGNAEKFLEIMQVVARGRLAEGDVARAGAGYQKIIQLLAPKSPEKTKGFIEEFLREFLQRDRIRELDQAFREMADSFLAQGNKSMWEELLRRLAEVYVSIYKLQDAIKVYRMIAEKQGEDPEVYLALGELYMKEENKPLALDTYMQAVRLFVKTNRGERAEEVFKFVQQKEPSNPSLSSKMGDIYYGIGQWDRALSYYRHALELNPDFRPAIIGTAMTYARKGMLGEMVALAKRLVTKGVTAEIVEEYRKALSASPNQAEASMSLGLLYKDLGFEEEAILEFQKASKDSKYFLQAYNQLGLCFWEQGFEDLAIRQYRKALERSGYSDEDLVEIRYNLARVYESVKMYREAHELYNDILVTDIGYKDVSERVKNLGNAPGSTKVVSPAEWGGGGKKS